MDRGEPRRVLFVCTANRARSPLAERLLRRMLEERGETEAAVVSSAGICTFELDRSGMPMDPKAVAVGQEFGVDGSDHVTRPLSRRIAEDSDLIIVMEGWQAEVLRTAFPAIAERVHLLSELGGGGGDIEDIALAPEEGVRAYCERAEGALDGGLNAGVLAETLFASAERPIGGD